MNKALLERWAQTIQAWKTSGQTAQTFAQTLGLSQTTLYKWASRLKTAPQAAQPPAFVQVVAKPAVTKPLPHSQKASIVVEMGQAKIHLQRGFDPQLLAEIVRILKQEAL